MEFFKKLFKLIIMKILSSRSIKKKVVFISFGGRQYSEDPRAISEKMHELYPEYELVWIISPEYRNKITFPEYIKCVGIREGMYKELSDAICFVTTNPLEPGIQKRDGQFFVQTWHGDRGFKKCLYEAWPDGQRPVEILDNKFTDLAIAASDYGEDVYRKAFRYYGQVLKIGMPRNDRLINPNEKVVLKIKKKLNIPYGAKVLTYAPTFRDSKNDKQSANINILQTLDCLNRKRGEWVCLIRAHAASMGIELEEKSSSIIDVTEVSDMADILQITDFLITDYSSCAGDFIVTGKPVILALFDKDDYENNNRELRFNVEESGYLIARNQKELMELINDTDEAAYKLYDEKVLKFYNSIETGKASEVICKMINDAFNKI